MDFIRKFRYAGRWPIEFAVVLFGISAAIIGSKAWTEYHKFRTSLAILDGLVCSLSILLAVLALAVAIYRRFLKPPLLTITNEGLFLPYGFAQRKTAWIPFAEISAVTDTRISGNQMLLLETPRRKFSVSSILMENQGQFEEAKRLLLDALGKRQLRDSRN